MSAQRLIRVLSLAGCAVLIAACARMGGGADADAAADRLAGVVTPVPVAHRWVPVGRSVEGRAIRALVVGASSAARAVLVVGCIHGDEPTGEAITRRLRSARPPAGVALWLVDESNPDGCRAGTRQNADGVDLNRNSTWHWRPLSAPFYSGPRPLSEPESRAINRLVRRVHPALTIWYHQHAALVDDSGGDRAVERRYARLVGLPFRHLGDYPGSITSWQNATFPGTTAFVVELPAGRLPSAAVARHVAAVLTLARALTGASGA
jgi:murein peptide amidase A